jgi:hypothetical protein
MVFDKNYIDLITDDDSLEKENLINYFFWFD